MKQIEDTLLHGKLKEYFGFSSFKGNQEAVIRNVLAGKDTFVLMPTGGGKSITFQLPALMQGELTRALTVVISPLQSLMKDQVENLVSKGISRAVTINGLLSPIERSRALEAVISGEATLLYIAPESLRSRSILAALQQRRVARFVIDEAHCFSVWGHDFRVDYLFIADFIKKLEDFYGGQCKIAVSCFTATAKQKVIQDICATCNCKIDVQEDGHVFVSAVDQEDAKRAIFTIKTIVEDPEIGAIYKGKVTRLMTFGAFAEVVPGVDGLIHISQIADRRIDKPSDVLAEGDKVDAKIIAIDEDKKKISLSIRALLTPAAEEEAPVEE